MHLWANLYKGDGNMRWQEVTVTTDHEAVEAVSNFFHEVGAGGVVVEDPDILDQYINSGQWDYYDLPAEMLEAEHVLIKGYLPVNPELPERLEKLKGYLTILKEKIRDLNIQVSINEVEEEDWANSWKVYFKPEKVTDKIIVVPSWEQYSAQAEELTISLDPGMAFGTGTHDTTRLSLQLLESIVTGGEKVFDVGTGSGVIAIAAAKLGCSQILATDIDKTAVETAQRNTAINEVNDRVIVVQGNLLDPLPQLDKPHIIVANIIADVILLLVKDAYKVLQPGGYFVTSGIIKARKNEVEKALVEAGFVIEKSLQNQDWIALLAKKE